MPAQSSESALRNRGGALTKETSALQTGASSQGNGSKEKLKTSRTPLELLADHPDIKPVTSTSTSSSSTTTSSSLSPGSTTILSESGKANSTIASPPFSTRILHILLKPFYFLLFVILHLGHELMISGRTIKTCVEVFFLPHWFPSSPGVVRVLKNDLGTQLEKKPKHLAIILPASHLSEQDEETWHKEVSELAQWSVATGIQCLSIMRTDPLSADLTDLLQERIEYELKEFYKEERSIPVVQVRTLKPVEGILQQQHVAHQQPDAPSKKFDLDVVILAERDGHDRLAASVRALGEAAIQKEIKSQDINIKFLDQQLSEELSEPELLIVFKDDLDLSSYPPWHIRLTEIL
ncbi:hypothetical protein BGZ76_006565 [Entomortierella beljakovae]|nr:hypothetical protein BGZ76_006565 [Entomortierella beljakovae]